MHIVLSVVTCVLYMLALGFGAAALGKRFRLYSLATMAALIATGVLTGVDGPRIAANLPTPWIGVWERISLGAAMLWIAVLSVAILCPCVLTREIVHQTPKAAIAHGARGTER
jgi:hypothetical protein